MDAEQRLALAGPLNRGEVVLTLVQKGRAPSSGFQSVMCRQINFVQDCIKAARAKGCDFLLHLDDDELLFPTGRSAGSKRKSSGDDVSSRADIAQILGTQLRSKKRCIHFSNVEAAFPFQSATQRPFTREGVRFRAEGQVLYCNGKSAANLRAAGGGPRSVYCSGVHHFCKYDRSFEPQEPKFGLHDEGGGCKHPDCCEELCEAVVLHFDSPSFVEWKAKFQARALSKFTSEDDDEMDIFPFKRESVDVLRKATATQRQQERVFRKWRCLPGRPCEDWDNEITGTAVLRRMQAHLANRRKLQGSA